MTDENASKTAERSEPADGQQKDPLSSRQRQFIAEYLVDRNGTQAAIRAGYSAASAKQQASRLLAHPKIRANLDAATEQLRLDAGVKAEDVVAQLKRIAWAEPSETIRTPDKLKALELLGKHLGMWIDRTEVAHGMTIEEMVLAADHLQRAEKAAKTGRPLLGVVNPTAAPDAGAAKDAEVEVQRAPTPPAPVEELAVRPPAPERLPDAPRQHASGRPSYSPPPPVEEARPAKCLTDFDPFSRN